MTESADDGVTKGKSQGVTLSKAIPGGVEVPERAPAIFRAGVLKPRDHYCAVPNVLMQQAGLFENTFDFAVYLHLFSKSYGFGRNTCDMGLAELERFTGLARNSVKKAIDRLVAAKWIRMQSDYEFGRVTRKWRVYSPYENGHTAHPTFYDSTGSPYDTVTTRQCHEATATGSPGAPVTESPRDTYKEIKKDTYKNNSLSACAEPIQQYFSELMAPRKRESEWQAYRELQAEFKEDEIGAALDHVRRKGLPAGDSCHSPMAYLATAMTDVLAVVKAQKEKDRKRAETAAALEAVTRRAAEAEARELRECEQRETAFNRAFRGEERQREVIAELCQGTIFRPATVAGRTYAIGAWWQEHRAPELVEGRHEEDGGL